MTARLLDMLLQRSERERVLLGLLVVIGLPLLMIFGILLPLRDAGQAARTAHQDAVALNVWVQERVTEKAAIGSAVVQSDIAPAGSSAIEQSLIEAGLRDAISDLGVGDDGAIDLRFDLVTFTMLADWISANSPTWGYDMPRFRFEATEVPGKISATLTLTPRP